MERKLKNWLQTYLEFTKHTEALEVFHLWTGIGVIAGALRKKVFFDQGYFKWTPNFYIVFVADPGIATKSTTISIGGSLLREVPGIKFGPNAITTAALTPVLAKAKETVLEPGGKYTEMSCLTFFSSELGTLLDPSDRRMLDLLCDLWDGWGGKWKKETKTMGSDEILNPWLNIIACTTPAWLADNLPRRVVGGGFTSRCVWVYGDRKRQLVPYPRDVLPKDHEERRQDLIHDLEVISTLKGEVTLTPKAKALGIAWYGDHNMHPPEGLRGEDEFKGYLIRKQGHLHKIATALSAAERNDLVITEDMMAEAIRLLAQAEQSMPKVFRAIFTSQSQGDVLNLVSIVQSKPGITIPALYRLLLHRMKLDEFKAAIDAAVQAQVLRISVDNGVSRLEAIQQGKGQN